MRANVLSLDEPAAEELRARASRRCGGTGTSGGGTSGASSERRRAQLIAPVDFTARPLSAFCHPPLTSPSPRSGMLRAMSSVGNEWRDQRAVLWDLAFRQREVASAFAQARKLSRRGQAAEAAEVEDVAYEMHGCGVPPPVRGEPGEARAADAAVRLRSKRRRG
jgi:hypothetical protein